MTQNKDSSKNQRSTTSNAAEGPRVLSSSDMFSRGRSKSRKQSSSSGTKKGRPKSLPFTKREIKFLHRGVKRFGMGAWEQIVSEYDFQEGRTAVSCRKKYLFSQDNPPETLESESDDDSYPTTNRSKKPIPFTKQEIYFLWEGVTTYGTNWSKILKSYKFQKGRSAKSIEHKYYRYVKSNPPTKDYMNDTTPIVDKKNRGKSKKKKLSKNASAAKFSEDECKYLFEGVGKYGRDAWQRILNEYAFKDKRKPDDLKEKFTFLEAQRAMNPSASTFSALGVSAQSTNDTDQNSSSNGPVPPGAGLSTVPGIPPPASSIGGQSSNADNFPLDAFSRTPMTPMSPSQLLDDIHLGGARSNPSSATTPQPTADHLQELYKQYIDDGSDYESDYDEFDPAPADQPPKGNPPAGNSHPTEASASQYGTTDSIPQIHPLGVRPPPHQKSTFQNPLGEDHDVEMQDMMHSHPPGLHL